MARWNHCVDLQVRPRQDKLYKRMRENKYESNFIVKFFKKYIKVPKLRKDELFEVEEESKDASPDPQNMMLNFVKIYLRTAQLIYELMPLASAIADDPYLTGFVPGRAFVDSYTIMMERTHIDLIRQAQIERIQNHVPSI